MLIQTLPLSVMFSLNAQSAKGASLRIGLEGTKRYLTKGFYCSLEFKSTEHKNGLTKTIPLIPQNQGSEFKSGPGTFTVYGLTRFTLLYGKERVPDLKLTNRSWGNFGNFEKL